MPNQFLLNPDGSMPAGSAPRAVYESLGIPLVRPVAPPAEDADYMAVEVDPVADGEGVLWQTWTLVARPAPGPAPVPEVVSRFQARAALSQMGLLDDAEALVLSQGALAAMAWQDISEFRRDSPLVNEIAPQLGLDDADVDDLFRLAATIRV